VRKGVPFRETHHVAGAAVALAEKRGVDLSSLSVADLQGLHPAFDQDVTQVWDFEQSVEQRDSTGGASRRSVLAQISQLRGWLDQPAP
jgi:argininosuccinate lyase